VALPRLTGRPIAVSLSLLASCFVDILIDRLKLQSEHMPKFIIEREIPGLGGLSADELSAASQRSCGVLRQMGPEIQWIESFVTADKLYCVYIAPNEETIREHAERGGFPANRISAIVRMIDPTTAEPTDRAVPA
jgi:hypothetical protein